MKTTTPLFPLVLAVCLVGGLAHTAELRSYPAIISQTNSKIVVGDHVRPVTFTEATPKGELSKSLIWMLKTEVLHPNAGGRLFAIHVVGRFTDKDKSQFELHGWWIKGPFLIETIDLHTDTSRVQFAEQLLPIHFSEPASFDDSEANSAYRNSLKISHHKKSSISWLGVKPRIVAALEK